MTDASNVRGSGTLFQWQALEKEEFDSAISEWGTDGPRKNIFSTFSGQKQIFAKY